LLNSASPRHTLSSVHASRPSGVPSRCRGLTKKVHGSGRRADDDGASTDVTYQLAMSLINDWFYRSIFSSSSSSTPTVSGSVHVALPDLFLVVIEEERETGKVAAVCRFAGNKWRQVVTRDRRQDLWFVCIIYRLSNCCFFLYWGHRECLASLVGPVRVLSAVMFFHEIVLWTNKMMMMMSQLGSCRTYGRNESLCAIIRYRLPILKSGLSHCRLCGVTKRCLQNWFYMYRYFSQWHPF